MAFIDEIQFHAKAGNGGSGVVRWRHEKGKEFSGASGGNAGAGGNVYVRAVRDINILARHKSIKQFSAKNGENGMDSSRHGKNGDDFYIDLPIGSQITNIETGRVVELVEEGQTSKILHGGRGGLGNEHFKASTNVRPEQSTEGTEGEEADFNVELNLIADAGLIGLPNAGKSSLLNTLTEARAKVGSYAFTTIDPNLGVLPNGRILADIPGIIEGASEGKGLGYKFLKHVKRTKILLHLIALKEGSSRDEKGDDYIDNYMTIRKELEKYGNGLSDKPEIIILTKTDLVNNEDIDKAKQSLAKFNKEILTVSVLDDQQVKILSREVSKLLV